MPTYEDVDRRLDSIEERIERLERLMFLVHADVRKVAEYAYMNVRLDKTADTIKPIPGLKTIQDRDAMSAGFTAFQLVVLKKAVRAVKWQSKQDYVGIARSLIQPPARLRKAKAEPEEASKVA
jgi:hypothetical protein